MCVGPEFGTVGDADIKKAALEAIKGSKCDLLLVCAFAFEAERPRADRGADEGDQARQAAVLPVRMNPDLAMGDELLKKTGGRQPVHRVRRAGREADDEGRAR